jgi:tRNA A-37 threonylcarbamoyl transferase component Bud32
VISCRCFQRSSQPNKLFSSGKEINGAMLSFFYGARCQKWVPGTKSSEEMSVSLATYDSRNPSRVPSFVYDLTWPGDELLEKVRSNLRCLFLGDALFLEVPGADPPFRYLSEDETLESAEATAEMKLTLRPPSEWAEFLLSPRVVKFLRVAADFVQVEHITDGAYGSVTLVGERGSDKKFALKRIDHYTAPDDKRIWLREITILSAIRYPSVIELFGVVLDQRPSLLTQFYPNRSILHYIEKHPGTLANTQKMIILVGVAKGMQFLHRIRIMHRDLKGDNILLDHGMHPIICDFGFSKKIDSKSNVFTSQCGTPGYSAPEMIQGERCSYPVEYFASEC